MIQPIFQESVPQIPPHADISFILFFQDGFAPPEDEEEIEEGPEGDQEEFWTLCPLFITIQFVPLLTSHPLTYLIIVLIPSPILFYFLQSPLNVAVHIHDGFVFCTT